MRPADSPIKSLQDLYQSSDSELSGSVLVLEQILKCAGDKLNIVEWGPGPGTQLFLNSPGVERVVSYENDEERYQHHCKLFQHELAPNGRLELKLVRLGPSRLFTENPSSSVYDPTGDYVLDALKIYGEDRFDMAFINGGGYRTDCAEIARLLVAEGGLIVWNGIETWDSDFFDFPSGRCFRDVLSMQPEYYYFDQHQTVVIVNRKQAHPYTGYPHIGAKQHLLQKTFDCLHQENILFVALRNPDEMPLHCSMQNDIDLLIHPADVKKATAIFSELGFGHWRDKGPGGNHLYSAKPHDHFIIPALDLHIDVVQGLYYTSPNGGEKVPVRRDLQEVIFARRRYVSDTWKCLPHVNDLFMHIACHALYDKKVISQKYKSQLERLHTFVDQDILQREIETIFFKFGPRLLEIVMAGESERLVTEYYRFSGY